MSNKFCRELSNGYKINVIGGELTWSPCCYYAKKIKLLDRPAFEEALAYTSSATGWLPECGVCKNLEAVGNTRLTPRLTSLFRIPEEVETGACVDLEISFDINCNAACLSCSGGFSTAWQKYEHKHQLFDYGPITDHAPRLLQELIDNVPLDQLRNLFILGGEPFYSNTHTTLLKHILQVHPEPEKIEVWYQSNGSLFPDEEVRALWTKFKKVVVSLSLDGVNNQFEYLRYPLTWNRVENTVSNLLEKTNAFITINSTINPLNILYFDELENWVTSAIPESRLGWRVKGDVIRLNQCWAPMNLNLSTPELKQACLEKYGENHGINQIFKTMHFGGKLEVLKMFAYIEKHDALRKLDWRTTFPKVVTFYKNILAP